MKERPQRGSGLRFSRLLKNFHFEHSLCRDRDCLYEFVLIWCGVRSAFKESIANGNT